MLSHRISLYRQEVEEFELDKDAEVVLFGYRIHVSFIPGCRLLVFDSCCDGPHCKGSVAFRPSQPSLT